MLIEKKFNCGYHNREDSEMFLALGDLKPCKLQCPVNKDEKCYRWRICYLGRTIEKDKR